MNCPNNIVLGMACSAHPEGADRWSFVIFLPSTGLPHAASMLHGVAVLSRETAGISGIASNAKEHAEIRAGIAQAIVLYSESWMPREDSNLN